MSTTIFRIGIFGLIENHDQERVLESRACQQRTDIGGEPLVSGRSI